MPPSPASSISNKGSDDNSNNTRMSEAALRKKKNADAQAAFRARRANYIATLEQTVTNLESVVIQLQDSCREAKNEIRELQADKTRIQHQMDDREVFWRTMFRTRKGQGADDEFPMPYSESPTAVASSSMHSSQVGHYPDDTLRYPTASDPTPSLPNNPSYHTGPQEYPQRSPALAFATAENDTANDGRNQHLDSHRVPRYGQYSYPIDNSNRDQTWTQPVGHQNGNEALEPNSASHSPTFVESPTITSNDVNYASRYPLLDEQKIPVTPGYVYTNSRSLSPGSSTPTSTSSTSLAATPYQFTFPDPAVVQDRQEFSNFRRPPPHHVPEMTLHGGTANISMPANGVRYRLGGNRPTSDHPERPIVPVLSSYSRTENGSHERESDESDPSHPYSMRNRPKRSTTSRSPSPGPAAICSTLAVIKAQAFGALRRTRTRGKKSSEGAAKAAVEALEARGIGMGVAVGSAAKRARMHGNDDGDVQV